MNTDQLQNGNHSFLTPDFLNQKVPEARLTIEAVENGFIISGYFAGAQRRCVVNGIPQLLRRLRGWWGDVKPAKPKAES